MMHFPPFVNEAVLASHAGASGTQVRATQSLYQCLQRKSVKLIQINAYIAI